MAMICMNCSVNHPCFGEFMDLINTSIPFEHHVLGWVKIKEYECPKCSNLVAQVEFLEVE